MLERALAGTQGPTPQPITDEFVLAIAKRLEARGITTVPGIPVEEPDEKPLAERLRAFLEEQHDIEERAAERQRQAEEEHDAPPAPQTTADIVREAISASTGSSGHIPLNGERVLRAALAGGPGTINGGAAE